MMSKDSWITLPDLLRQFRKSIGMNQTEFARRYGLATATGISKMESDKSSLPNTIVEDLIKHRVISELEDIDAYWNLNESQNKQRTSRIAKLKMEG